MLTPHPAISNLNRIYEEGFKYYLPRHELEECLAGIAFENVEGYTQDESAKLLEDIQDIFSSILSQNPTKGSVATLVVGSSESGKTSLIQRKLKELAAGGASLAYICPDHVCMSEQKRTYLSEPEAKGEPFNEGFLKAYKKWRPGSHAATHLILANLIRERYSFFFEPSLTVNFTDTFLQFLKRQGYTIKIWHTSAPEELRVSPLQGRAKKLSQIKEPEIKDKELFAAQLIPSYLNWAESIDFYYRDKSPEEVVLSSIWLKQERKPCLKIYNWINYEKIKELYHLAIDANNNPELVWEKIVESRSEIQHFQTLEGLERVLQNYFQVFSVLCKSEDWNALVIQEERALFASRITKRVQDEAKISSNLTSTYFYLGNYSKAQIYSQRCRVLSKEFSDLKLYVRALYLESAVNRAIAGKANKTQKQQELYAKAVSIANEALEVYHLQKLDDQGLQGKIFFNMGAAHADNPTGDLIKASECYQKALDCFENTCPDDFARTQNRLAKVLILQKKYTQAERIIASLRNSNLSQRLTMHTELLESQFKLELGQKEAAKNLAQKGLAIAKALNAQEDANRFISLIQKIDKL